MLDLNPDVKARVVQGVYPARLPQGRFGGRGAAEAREASSRLAGRGGGGGEAADRRAGRLAGRGQGRGVRGDGGRSPPTEERCSIRG